MVLPELVVVVRGAMKEMVSIWRVIAEKRFETRWQMHRVLRSRSLLRIWRMISSGNWFSEDELVVSCSCD